MKNLQLTFMAAGLACLGLFGCHLVQERTPDNVEIPPVAPGAASSEVIAGRFWVQLAPGVSTEDLSELLDGIMLDLPESGTLLIAQAHGSQTFTLVSLRAFDADVARNQEINARILAHLEAASQVLECRTVDSE